MSKPAHCEWSDCKNKPKFSVTVDGEKYWFCSERCKDKFWEEIQEEW